MISVGWLLGALLLEGVGFGAVIVLLLRQHHAQTRDLLNRLMARDFVDYQAAATGPQRWDGRRHNVIAGNRERQEQATRQTE